MSGRPGLDFASLLDDLMEEAPDPGPAASPAVVAFDYLAVADELHSGRIRVTAAAAAAGYRESGEIGAELAELLAGLADAPAAPEPEPLPSVEPEAIAIELGLPAAAAAELGRIRRTFAMLNHPDRVAPHLRQRALVRMQVANMLIDEARRRAAK